MKTASAFPTLVQRLKAFEQAAIYPVITPEYCAGRDPFEIFCAVVSGGAKLIQIRCKSWNDRAVFDLLCACRKVATEHRVLLIADDRIDLALAANADGVHLGQEDLPPAAAKSIAPELLVGISTHNAGELHAAHGSGADYLNIGPVFPTGTKAVQYPAVGTATLAELIPQLKMPFSVMGGIKSHHLPELRKLGVTHPAMVTEITLAPDVASKTAELIKLFNAPD